MFVVCDEDTPISFVPSPPDSRPLTLDPNTAHRELCLSEGNRRVTHCDEYQSYPSHPDRFDVWEQVLGREGTCDAATGRWSGVGRRSPSPSLTKTSAGKDTAMNVALDATISPGAWTAPNLLTLSDTVTRRLNSPAPE